MQLDRKLNMNHFVSHSDKKLRFFQDMLLHKIYRDKLTSAIGPNTSKDWNSCNDDRKVNHIFVGNVQKHDLRNEFHEKKLNS
jgi:hypothetical protein